MSENRGEKQPSGLPEPLPANPVVKLEEHQLRESAPLFLQQAMERGIVENEITGTPELFQEGDSSAVYKVVTEKGPLVIKMVTNADALQGEIDFLNAWREQGVKTPTIELRHVPDEKLPIAIAQMEFINAPLLEKTMSNQDMVQRGISRELGRIQARMHAVTAEGFGMPYGHRKYHTFTEEVQHHILGSRSAELLKSGLVTPHDLEIAQQAVDLLEADIQAGRKPTLTHNDLRPYNILASDPVTVIDPEPRISHPYMCLGLTVLKSRIMGSDGEESEISAGYAEISPIDNKVLEAAITLKAISKIRTWSRMGKTEWVKKAQQMVRETQL